MKRLASLMVLVVAVGMFAVPWTASADHLGYPHNTPRGGVTFGPNGYVAKTPVPGPAAPLLRFDSPYNPYKYVAPAPAPTWVWQPGWWNWDGQQWSWTPSHWVQVYPY